MKKYRALLFDADETLLDFKRSERTAFSKTIANWSIADNDSLYQQYSESNARSWKLFEKGEITKERLVIYRFEQFFQRSGLSFSAEEWNEYYKKQLGNTAFLLDGAEELLEYVVKHYSLYMVTNGLQQVQQNRICNAGIGKYFKKIFTSEAVGAQKPQKEFFDRVFEEIPFLPNEVLLIGDSPTSDILGGISYGIDTCHFCSDGITTDLNPTYTVSTLSEMMSLLEKLW